MGLLPKLQGILPQRTQTIEVPTLWRLPTTLYQIVRATIRVTRGRAERALKQ